MEEFYLEYFIENKYETPVRKATFQLLVIPDSSKDQSIFDLKFSCIRNHEMHVSTNLFGFRTINCYIDKPFDEFWFRLYSKIQKPEINPFLVSPMMPDDEFAMLNSLDFYIDNFLFLTPTILTTLPTSVNFSFPEYSKGVQVFDYLIQLNTFIYHLLEYSPASTDINTPIEEILQIRKGVCQDYAHLFISVCRKNKIPVRYVSGYLNQGADFIGSGQLHAWVEALIPGLGWVGFDSTNNLLANQHYIKIAHGTDYRDCSPIIGVLESTGKQKSTHSVTVSNQ